MMSSLVECFDQFVKEKNLLKQEENFFILKGEGEKSETKILVPKSSDIVVFNVRTNSHSKFVTEGYYNQNCDYIFIKIKKDEINFLLCELKASENKIKKGYQQLKCSIPLAHYLKKLLDTHFENYSQTEIKYKKILIIKKERKKEEPKEERGVFIFYGSEFSLKQLFNES